jgi:hypothetical protein
MIYVVTEGKILTFPTAVVAKASGSGGVVHVIGQDDKIIGNVPMKIVKFYGPELPEVFKDQLRVQERWASLTPEERERERREGREKRQDAPPA